MAGGRAGPAARAGPRQALSGLANPIANGPANTLVTLAVPEPLRAKTMFASITASTAAGGAGLFIAGPLPEALAARQVFAKVI